MPPRLLVIGGGPIGMELAQSMQRLGCAVTVLEAAPKPLIREDPDAADIVIASLLADGVTVHTNVVFDRVECSDDGNLTHAPFVRYTVHVKVDGKPQTFEADALLNGTGRVPNVVGLGLEDAQVDFDVGAGVLVDEHYCTTNPSIYACGDVSSPFKFTHTADFAARCAIRNMFLGDTNTEAQLVIPWCTYTDPEIAHVGKYVSPNHSPWFLRVWCGDVQLGLALAAHGWVAKGSDLGPTPHKTSLFLVHMQV
jgi:pyruvate/2-oxoglutarate dehydrogenase complex dihydrolipoamide dehydrogenase (E3) component